jgi:hypothetical protein
MEARQRYGNPRGWQEELIAAAAKWPLGFRAHLSAGIWVLLGAPDTVQQEFWQRAERIRRELRFPHRSNRTPSPPIDQPTICGTGAPYCRTCSTATVTLLLLNSFPSGPVTWSCNGTASPGVVESGTRTRMA